MGYENVTALELLNHMRDSYGTINEDMMANNMAEMDTLWAPSTPLKHSITQIKKCCTFAEKGGDNVTEASVICREIKIIKGNGMFKLSRHE